MDRFLEQVAIEASQMYVTEDGKSRFANTVGFVTTSIYDYFNQFKSLIFILDKFQTIEKLPDKVLLNIFAYLSHLEICRMGKFFHHLFFILKNFHIKFLQLPCVVVGDKLLMIQSCGKTFHCDQKFQVCCVSFNG